MSELPTQDEIVKKLREVNRRDVFGLASSDLLEYLDFEHAKEFLVETATPEKWAESARTLTRESVLKELREYMPFAFEKARGERGLSAGRSILHMINWTFLAGDYELSKELERPYVDYGEPHLEKVCKHYGLPIPGADQESPEPSP